jgi:hypothetical protein
MQALIGRLVAVSLLEANRLQGALFNQQMEDAFALFFGAHIQFIITHGAHFGMTPLEILPNQEQGHQQYKEPSRLRLASGRVLWSRF